jgi:hypothetical protein
MRAPAEAADAVDADGDVAGDAETGTDGEPDPVAAGALDEPAPQAHRRMARPIAAVMLDPFIVPSFAISRRSRNRRPPPSQGVTGDVR